MTQPKWTPGPWTAVNRGTKSEPMFSVMAARIAGRPPRHEVAICATGDSPQEMETANAHLCAAAPEMYEALHNTTSLLRSFASKTDEISQLAISMAEDAMAKARGET
jgi:hypothetical protein